MLHAAGIAWAMKLREEKRVAITYFGDGATSEGDFHGAMNFAVLKVPVIFYCQNNQWAISVPVSSRWPPRPSRRRPSPTGCRRSRWTATTSSRCTRRPRKPASGRSRATGRRSSRA
jgi:hypothetical protein